MKVSRASANTELRKQAKPSKKAKVPRSCSEVFRLWASIGIGLLFTIVFEIVVIVLVRVNYAVQVVLLDAHLRLELGNRDALLTLHE